MVTSFLGQVVGWVKTQLFFKLTEPSPDRSRIDELGLDPAYQDANRTEWPVRQRLFLQEPA
jgi:hypothetical protein